MIDLDGFKEHLTRQGYKPETVRVYCSDLSTYSKAFDDITAADLLEYAKIVKRKLYGGELSEHSSCRKITAIRKYCDFIGFDWKTALPKDRRIKKSKSPKKKTLEEVMADIDRYNKKHGARLSYGKYKAMEKRGLIE